MPTVSDTAYPYLSRNPSSTSLEQLYTPTADELDFATRRTRSPVRRLGLLVLLKTFQRLGYAVAIDQIPSAIIQHLQAVTAIQVKPRDWQRYATAKPDQRHLQWVRQYWQIEPFRTAGKAVMENALATAAKTKQDLVDLINIAVQTLAQQRIELPGFTTLERAARQARNQVNQQCYETVSATLSQTDRQQLQRLLQPITDDTITGWEKLKQEPGKPLLSQLKDWLQRLRWLRSIPLPQDTLDKIPRAKVLHFAAVAQTLDVHRMKSLPMAKRLSLIVALLSAQVARTLDDLAELFIKRMRQLHHHGKQALADYRQETQQRTDQLITTFKSLVMACQTEAAAAERLAAIDQVLGDNAPQLVEQCDAHLAYVGDNYFPFLLKRYRAHRSVFFMLLDSLPLQSSTQDTALIDAIGFIRAQRAKRKTWLSLTESLDLSWVPQSWWRLVTGQKKRTSQPTQVHRTYFELCVSSQLLLELQSGDVYLQGGDEYSDYYGQLISWDEYRAQVQEYGQQIQQPVEPKAFVQQLQQQLTEAANTADQAFPNNTQVSYQKGRLVIHKTKSTPTQGLAQLEALIQQRLQPVHLLDILTDTQAWLNWTKPFGPISGYETKLEQPVLRYLITTFCYGCSLGPSQTARALPQVERRMLSHVHHRHISDEKLQQALLTLLNHYHQFQLPRYWGSGKHAAVDGTKWEVYENNLLAEYHIRYRGYGAIGYYHIADSYIALFSNFIPCGVWEAVYMLDGVLFNQSDIQPHTIHGDTQAQSATVFALAHLMGITLMPRIRRWQQLAFYRPEPLVRYQHLEPLFTKTVDWALIERHLPDMLRVACSIRAGKLKPSTILRKLGTNSRKNKLFQAFSELGAVLRTRFLLQYLNQAELRNSIQAAINKSESFHRFAKWLAFGSEFTGLAVNNRDEMRKRIKYNQLVANCVILHNAIALTQLLNQLHQEGLLSEPEAIAALSPYRTEHINRFGRFFLDIDRQPPPFQQQLDIGLPGQNTPQ